VAVGGSGRGRGWSRRYETCEGAATTSGGELIGAVVVKSEVKVTILIYCHGEGPGDDVAGRHGGG
jgi:hypothetical protein